MFKNIENLLIKIKKLPMKLGFTKRHSKSSKLSINYSVVNNKKITALISVYDGNYKKIEKECLKLGIEVVLYNKKNNKFGKPIKNVGVDAYDKIHFIIENYTNLPDIILFSTDNMFGEPKKAKKIRFILDYIDILKNRSGFLTGHIFKIPQKEITFTLDKRHGTEIIKSSIRPFDKWFNKFIDKETKVENIYVCKKSTFAVTKDLILKISKKNYEKLLNEIEKHSLNGHDSEVPHYFERSYVELFCKNDTSLMFHDFKTYGSL